MFGRHPFTPPQSFESAAAGPGRLKRMPHKKRQSKPESVEQLVAMYNKQTTTGAAPSERGVSRRRCCGRRRRRHRQWWWWSNTVAQTAMSFEYRKKNAKRIFLLTSLWKKDQKPAHSLTDNRVASFPNLAFDRWTMCARQEDMFVDDLMLFSQKGWVGIRYTMDQINGGPTLVQAHERAKDLLSNFLILTCAKLFLAKLCTWQIWTSHRIGTAICLWKLFHHIVAFSSEKIEIRIHVCMQLKVISTKFEMFCYCTTVGGM